jgi:hypothetical protein
MRLDGPPPSYTQIDEPPSTDSLLGKKLAGSGAMAQTRNRDNKRISRMTTLGIRRLPRKFADLRKKHWAVGTQFLFAHAAYCEQVVWGNWPI